MAASNRKPISRLEAEQIRNVFKHFGIRYLFIGKLGAILLGFSATTQDADLFIETSTRNIKILPTALAELGFEVNQKLLRDVETNRERIRPKFGPFDLDLIFVPYGLPSFAEVWDRRIEIDGFPICHPDDILRCKEAAPLKKDLDSLRRLHEFRDSWVRDSNQR